MLPTFKLYPVFSPSPTPCLHSHTKPFKYLFFVRLSLYLKLFCERANNKSWTQNEMVKSATIIYLNNFHSMISQLRIIYTNNFISLSSDTSNRGMCYIDTFPVTNVLMSLGFTLFIWRKFWRMWIHITLSTELAEVRKIIIILHKCLNWFIWGHCEIHIFKWKSWNNCLKTTAALWLVLAIRRAFSILNRRVRIASVNTQAYSIQSIVTCVLKPLVHGTRHTDPVLRRHETFFSAINSFAFGMGWLL